MTDPVDAKKSYPKRGAFQLFRFDHLTQFECNVCGETKKSKLIAIRADDWSRKICNGCYGEIIVTR
jgi:hypothetical protein